MFPHHRGRKHIVLGVDPIGVSIGIGMMLSCMQDISYNSSNWHTYGPRGENTCLRGFLQSEFQTSLLSYRD